jgi:hypothetical protein
LSRPEKGRNVRLFHHILIFLGGFTILSKVFTRKVEDLQWFSLKKEETG